MKLEVNAVGLMLAIRFKELSSLKISLFLFAVGRSCPPFLRVSEPAEDCIGDTLDYQWLFVERIRGRSMSQSLRVGQKRALKRGPSGQGTRNTRRQNVSRKMSSLPLLNMPAMLPCQVLYIEFPLSQMHILQRSLPVKLSYLFQV